MADVKIAFSGASAQSVSCSLHTTPLGDGSWWQSAVVDNTVNLYVDYLAGGLVTTGGTAPTANTTVDIFVYGQWDASGDYTGGCSGSDASYTPGGQEFALKRLAVVIVDTDTNAGYEWGPISVAQAFGGAMPQRFGFAVQNNTGQAPNGTAANHEFRVTGVYYTVA